MEYFLAAGFFLTTIAQLLIFFCCNHLQTCHTKNTPKFFPDYFSTSSNCPGIFMAFFKMLIFVKNTYPANTIFLPNGDSITCDISEKLSQKNSGISGRQAVLFVIHAMNRRGQIFLLYLEKRFFRSLVELLAQQNSPILSIHLSFECYPS